MEENCMAKIDNNSPFGDGSYLNKLKKVKLDPTRQNLKPLPEGLSIEQIITQLVKEGNELLEAEAKTKPSVKSTPESKAALEDALGKMSDNPYIRARVQLLRKMTPEARSVIEKMEKGTLAKDHRYDDFCNMVTRLGDKLSSNN